MSVYADKHGCVPGSGQRQERQRQEHRERKKQGGLAYGVVQTFSHRKSLESAHLFGQVESVLSHWEALHSDRQPNRTAAKVSLTPSLYLSLLRGAVPM